MDAGHWIFLILFLLSLIVIAILGFSFHRRGLRIRDLEVSKAGLDLRVKELEARLHAKEMSDDELAGATGDPTHPDRGSGPFRSPGPGEPTPFG